MRASALTLALLLSGCPDGPDYHWDAPLCQTYIRTQDGPWVCGAYAGVAPEAVNPPHGADYCAAPYEDTDSCAGCVRASCCAEVVDCIADPACACNLAERTPGISWPAGATCDTPNSTTDAAFACLQRACADACPLTPES